jgi:hypothetical protein
MTRFPNVHVRLALALALATVCAFGNVARADEDLFEGLASTRGAANPVVNDALGLIAESLREGDGLVRSGHLEEALESYGIALEASQGRCAQAALASGKICYQLSSAATTSDETLEHYKKALAFVNQAIQAGREWPQDWPDNARWGEEASAYGHQIGPFAQAPRGVSQLLILAAEGRLEEAAIGLRDLADLGAWRESESLFFLADVLLQQSAAASGAEAASLRAQALKALGKAIAAGRLQSNLFPRNGQYAQKALAFLDRLQAAGSLTTAEYGAVKYAGVADGTEL